MAETDPSTERATTDRGSRDGATTGSTGSSEGRDVTFTLAGVREGFVTGFPVAIGVAGYGIVFGVLAGRAGLSVAEAGLMSATVLAGAAQLIAVELWADSVPAVTVIATVGIVNLRYLLLGAALRPWFRHLSPRAAYGSVFFTADENWALTIARLREGSRRGAFLLGSGLVLWLLWIAATVLGVTAGDLVGDPAQYGLDFVVIALFLTLAAGLWEGRESVQPWLAAAGVALAANAVLPGEWYVIVGAFAGAGVRMVTHDG
ncbi:AzlC family ABC transporter permease [Halococcus saccharolyticus]|uniref:AzlC family protein n=1 Tax=Halococcus saccharolyticus DSM 5350 TaxID=1227455 RepID=M0MIC4_9EURY|nr:AzlC family ABC transporter permease [Halococcus saccharolyticus]EMA45462.1 AzlC family protein [Halococcus saccharolyticus DSM 5350]